MKFRTKILIILSITITAGFLILGNFGGRLIIQINQEMYNVIKDTDKHKPTVFDYGLVSKPITYISNDGLKLTALFVKSHTQKEKGTIILVHGIRSCKAYYLPISKLLAENGYNSVLVDLRAHGQSEGRYCTFGFHEKLDMSILIDSLCLQHNISDNIGIWGNSLGAAISLQTMSIDHRIKFGVIESTFSDFKTVVHEYSERTIGVDIPVINDYFIWWAELIGDFNGDEVKPCESVKSIKQPLIMVHGTADKNINIKYGKLNFKNLASENKEFIEIPNANHGNVWKVGGKSYFDKIISFLNIFSLDDSKIKDV